MLIARIENIRAFIFTSQVSRADLCDRELHSLDPPKAPLRGVPHFNISNFRHKTTI
ncbi:hypothetical protein [Campylobacter lanienae]|uniref:hypothetical protein n=1 Tax=Campylobacter lanienae TaxID=75658 RepID=UPI002A91D925|nr:hypothetical protein [Campylobacter lanienae]MDY6135411.1 hypothetical protein [Campylobacter lanienae]